MNVHAFLTGLPVTLAVSLAVFVLSWLVAVRIGRYNVVDVTWGLSFVAVAGTSLLWSSDGSAVRRALVAVMTVSWGLRLASYIGWRSRGHGEDPRYAAMLSRAQGSRAAWALRNIFVLQAVIAWFVSLPVQAALHERAAVDPLLVIGAVIWAIGLFFEAVGDAQLAAFKRDPAHRGTVMDRGLWRYTRHPNYFGDACVWAGLWLAACSHWVGALTFPAPLVMGWFLSMKTGKPLLEKAMASRPGYDDYVRRTSGFFPLPPKRA